ncbi:hypothetical protein CASFOL_027943 [Castilleja foliolosa]|uniref:Uncharacterized protein n=1 Tax=Castilleja foliolosa TaxID=1961234 RepID=A0ABD3CHE3_9LAMI
MQRSYNYRDGSKSSIDEYIERVTRMQQMPSVLSDYPEVTKRHEDHHHHPIKIISPNHDDRQHQAPETHKKARDYTHKKVYFTEHDDNIAIEIGTRGKKHDAYVEKSIDLEADGYITQKHKNFESCKYDTFKAY